MNDHYLEEVATGIFENIGRLKYEMSIFDWHDELDDGDRDRRFLVLKTAMDLIWDQIRRYRADCWESGLKQDAKQAAMEITEFPF